MKKKIVLALILLGLLFSGQIFTNQVQAASYGRSSKYTISKNIVALGQLMIRKVCILKL